MAQKDNHKPVKPLVKHRLEDAKINLLDAAALLDQTASHCNECDRKKFTNWEEAQMAIELVAMVNKINRWLSWHKELMKREEQES